MLRCGGQADRSSMKRAGLIRYVSRYNTSELQTALEDAHDLYQSCKEKPCKLPEVPAPTKAPPRTRHTHAHTHAHTTCASAGAHTRPRAHARACAHTHTYARTHTHAHTCQQRQQPMPVCAYVRHIPHPQCTGCLRGTVLRQVVRHIGIATLRRDGCACALPCPPCRHHAASVNARRLSLAGPTTPPQALNVRTLHHIGTGCATVRSWAAVGSDGGTAWLVTRLLERRDGNVELIVNIACALGSMLVEVIRAPAVRATGPAIPGCVRVHACGIVRPAGFVRPSACMRACVT